MKFPHFLGIGSLLLIVSLVLVARGDDDEHEHGEKSAPAHAEGSREMRPNLEHDMEAMGKAFKQLRAQIADGAKNEASLVLVLQMQQSTLSAKTGIPPLVRRMPATQQSEERNNYRQMMVNVARMELDLEEQLINNDNKAAAKTLDEMDKLQKDGHKEFRPKKRGHDED